MSDEMTCPQCGAPCYRDEVDIGVGVQYGPWCCIVCPWPSDEKKEDSGAVPASDPAADEWSEHP